MIPRELDHRIGSQTSQIRIIFSIGDGDLQLTMRFEKLKKNVTANFVTFLYFLGGFISQSRNNIILKNV